MNNKFFRIILLCVFCAAFGPKGRAQDHTYQSVLSQYTWHRIAVTQEGIYKLDYATLKAIGVDVDALNPNEIRLFGNPSG